jgi:hypothetical protein
MKDFKLGFRYDFFFFFVNTLVEFADYIILVEISF